MTNPDFNAMEPDSINSNDDNGFLTNNWSPSDLLQMAAMRFREGLRKLARLQNGSSAMDGLDFTDLWILGQEYTVDTDGLTFNAGDALNDRFQVNFERLSQRFRSLIWLTYRHGISFSTSPIYTSDIGWGCMIRSGQMLLAQTLYRHRLAIGGIDGDRGSQPSALLGNVIEMFIDQQLPQCLFSIQNIVDIGERKHGIMVGKWYGPTPIAHTLAELVNNASDLLHMNALVIQDACINVEVVRKLMEKMNLPLLLLIPLRLGTECINPVYLSSVKAELKKSTSVGMCGGRPNSALYFFGVSGDGLLYLDPHHAQNAVDFNSFPVDSFRCDHPQKMNVRDLDPSLLLGHLFCSLDEFHHFCADFERSDAEQSYSLVKSQQQSLADEDALEIYSIHSEEEE